MTYWESVYRGLQIPWTEQDTLAAVILEELASERCWETAFATSNEGLAQLVDEALAEHRTSLNSGYTASPSAMPKSPHFLGGFICPQDVIWNGGPSRKGALKMHNIRSRNRSYVLAAILGAIGGGLVVALATRAIPKMMAGMMRNMMAHMGEAGCDPAEM